MRLFDEDADGVLTGDETLRMLRSFAEPMARADADDGECTAEEVEEAVRELHDLLSGVARNRDAVDVDDLEMFLERMDEDDEALAQAGGGGGGAGDEAGTPGGWSAGAT